MPDPLIKFAQILLAFYFAGEAARQNPKVDALIGSLEDGYGAFNARLSDTDFKTGVVSLKKFYGWIASLSAALFLLLQALFGLNASLLGVLSWVALLSGFGWFSIRWCLEHKKAIQKTSSDVLFFILSPLLMGFLDFLCDTQFTRIVADLLYTLPMYPNWPIPRLTAPLEIGGGLSLVLAATFGIIYLLLWVFAMPVAFVSLVVVVVAVNLARFIHRMSPNKPLWGFAFILFSVLTLLS